MSQLDPEIPPDTPAQPSRGLFLRFLLATAVAAIAGFLASGLDWEAMLLLTVICAPLAALSVLLTSGGSRPVLAAGIAALLPGIMETACVFATFLTFPAAKRADLGNIEWGFLSLCMGLAGGVMGALLGLVASAPVFLIWYALRVVRRFERGADSPDSL